MNIVVPVQLLLDSLRSAVNSGGEFLSLSVTNGELALANVGKDDLGGWEIPCSRIPIVDKEQGSKISYSYNQNSSLPYIFTLKDAATIANSLHVASQALAHELEVGDYTDKQLHEARKTDIDNALCEVDDILSLCGIRREQP